MDIGEYQIAVSPPGFRIAVLYQVSFEITEQPLFAPYERPEPLSGLRREFTALCGAKVIMRPFFGSFIHNRYSKRKNARNAYSKAGQKKDRVKTP
jgi:hypothetical protein